MTFCSSLHRKWFQISLVISLRLLSCCRFWPIEYLSEVLHDGYSSPVLWNLFPEHLLPFSSTTVPMFPCRRFYDFLAATLSWKQLLARFLQTVDGCRWVPLIFASYYLIHIFQLLREISLVCFLWLSFQVSMTDHCACFFALKKKLEQHILKYQTTLKYLSERTCWCSKTTTWLVVLRLTIVYKLWHESSTTLHW